MALRGPTDAGLADFLLGQLLGCRELLQAGTIVVGFSGGLDSTVLLHSLAVLRQRGSLSGTLSALHVHHGLQTAAEDWLAHCKQQAALHQINFLERRVQVSGAAGASPEEAARDARYAAFAEHLVAPGSVLALAHHADDQVETVLLRLLRGSGPRGLAGMPARRALGAGQLVRPLLAASRAQLLQYARDEGLVWIEDPSNADTRYTRNHLRQHIVPALLQLSPGLLSTAARSAHLCAEAEVLQEELAAMDLKNALGDCRNQLRLPALAMLSPVRQRNLLRYWTRGLQDELQGSAITHQALQHCLEQVLTAADDAVPFVAWGSKEARLELRRFQNCLYLVKPMPLLPDSIGWDPAMPLVLPGVLGTLHCEVEGRAPMPGSWPLLDVRFRRGGERLALPGRPIKALKALLHESAVPPWIRPCIPLVHSEGVLLAVGDLFVQACWPVQVPGKTATFRWERQQLHCGY